MRASFLVLLIAILTQATFVPAEAPADESSVANAAEKQQEELVRKLTIAGTDVNVAQPDGMTALHWAVYHDEVQLAKLLIAAGADVKAKNRYEVTPLSLACTNGNGELVSLLLQHSFRFTRTQSLILKVDRLVVAFL